MEHDPVFFDCVSFDAVSGHLDIISVSVFESV